MKLAHYLHIAPRTLFMAQGLATLIGAIVQCGVTVFMITRIEGICKPDSPGGFSCPHGHVTYSSSLVWGGSFFLPIGHNSVLTSAGALGPARNFASGQIYGNLLWFFLVGPVVVVVTYLLGRRWKQVNYISWPVAFGAMSQVPPATGISFSSWWIVNIIFNGLIKRRKPAWWAKYSESLPFVWPTVANQTDYVLSAALDSGVAVATVVIFFCIMLPAGMLHWWGNNVHHRTADDMGTPWKTLPESGYFGPEMGTWR